MNKVFNKLDFEKKYGKELLLEINNIVKNNNTVKFKVFTDFDFKSKDGNFKSINNYIDLDVPYLEQYLFNYYFGNNYIFIVAVIDHDIIGNIALFHSKKNNNSYVLDSIGVSEDYQNKGIASSLIEKMFSFFMNEKIFNIIISSYNEEGKEKIKHKMKNISKKYDNFNIVD